jgi:hypothetical protein
MAEKFNMADILQKIYKLFLQRKFYKSIFSESIDRRIMKFSILER